MYILNKIVGGFLNPIGIGLMLILGGCLFYRVRRVGVGLCALAFVWFLLCSSPWFCNLLRLPLDDGSWKMRVEDLPQADAIVLLGGGMTAKTNNFPYAEITSAGDRVWHAARLFKAGKAPRILCTGKGNEASTKGLLTDLGVPTDALVFLDRPRNTEEEAREIAVRCTTADYDSKPKVLLVTSAWHMKRAKLMFERYAPGLEIVPAPTDCEAAMVLDDEKPWLDYLPNKDAFACTCALFKEHLGSWGYRLLRWR